MSRAESPSRLLDAAIRLGIAEGAGALSIQGIATTAGVSKALVLYHYGDKEALLAAVVRRLGEESAARLGVAAVMPDPLAGWRELAREEAHAGSWALGTALMQERALAGGSAIAETRRAREAQAALLAAAVLRAVGLTPRVPAALAGRALLRLTDGLAVAAAQGGLTDDAIEEELDALSLAFLGLGR